jgi:biotin carboxyl carrier protein
MNVTSPVAGQLIACLVKEGDRVEADTEIAIVEAMKMHIPVSAERAGRVATWLWWGEGHGGRGPALLTLEA